MATALIVIDVQRGFDDVGAWSPTGRRDNPLSVFNPTWDARRLWVTGYVEAQRKLKIDGKARDGEDVSELARRLNLSSYFYDVKLLPATRESDFVRFSIEAKVRY